MPTVSLRSTAGLLLFLPWLPAQGPLSPPSAPPQNQVTAAKAVLGKILFWEEQLSSNNRVACGTCHTFGAGGGDTRRTAHPGADGVIGTGDDTFGSPGLPAADAANDLRPGGAFGFGDQVTGRSTPSALTGAYFRDNFWDGRAADTFTDPQSGIVLIPTGGSLESQAIAPIQNAVEMSHDARSWSQVVAKLTACRPMALATFLPPDVALAIQQNPTYPALFQAAFGTPSVTAGRIGMAIATYERTLVPNQAPVDLGTMTFFQQMGSNMFGQFCAVCHSGPLFSDGQFHNLGRRPIAADSGRQAVTGNFADRGKFKTPSLRNVGLRSTFFHDGSLTTLAQVIAFYTAGGGPNLDNKDPLLAQVAGLPPMAQTVMVDFLANALTDPRVAQGLPPFDRPVLASQRIPQNGILHGLGTAGTGGMVPEMLAGVPANLGNVDFRIGVTRALGGAPLALLVATAAAPPGSMLLGANLNVSLPAALTYVIAPGQGPVGVAGAGFATVREPLPDDPALVGATLFVQWGTIDAGAPGGVASSRGAEVRLF